MTTAEIIAEINTLAGRDVILEGYIGHRLDWKNIHAGDYEETWIAAGLDDELNRVRVRVPSSPAYPRPFRLHEMVHGTRTGTSLNEITEMGVSRFAGRLERSDIDGYVASLHDLRWCELPFTHRVLGPTEDDNWSELAEVQFRWLFALTSNAPIPEMGVPISEFLGGRSGATDQHARVSGVIILECPGFTKKPPTHILTASLADEHTPSRCARIELLPLGPSLPRMPLNVDIEDRFPDFRVFKCIVKGDYQPEQREHWAGTFRNIEELVVVHDPAPPKWPGDLGSGVRCYISFPKELLRVPEETNTSLRKEA